MLQSSPKNFCQCEIKTSLFFSKLRFNGYDYETLKLTLKVFK